MGMVVPISRRLVICVAIFLAIGAVSASADQQPAAPQIAPSLPESAVEPPGLIAEPAAVERAALFMDRQFGGDGGSNGFFVDFANMISGAGWLSLGPGYRHWYGHDSVFVETAAAISTNRYKTVRGRIELPRLFRSRLAIGTQYNWQDSPLIAHFGEGPDTQNVDRGRYHLRAHNLTGYATVRPVEWLGIGGQVGWLDPEIVDNVFGPPDQPTFIQTEASITADTRDFAGHPTRGSVLRAATAKFSDRGAGVFTFKRHEAEAAHFQPLAGSRVVVAVRGWLVTSDPQEGQTVPFYLQPSLGGPSSHRGYTNYRFHDRNMLLLNVETRLALMTHVDAAAFVDAGNVAARVRDLGLGKRAYGAGLRFHSRRQTFARFDVARGEEGWNFHFKLSYPLTLSRLERHTVPAPFVP
jgi:outer membrane protein assembly factor BamA